MEAVRFYIDRIQADQRLNAWLEVYAEEALAAAASMDKEDRPINSSCLYME